MVHADQKAGSIQRLLEVEQFDALIAFVRTKQATLDYAELLERQGYRAAALNGDMPQAQRERVIESLKDGSLDIVIATDVAARGLDVPRITHVLNIDMPYDPESYVHRIGRTGRAGRRARAVAGDSARAAHAAGDRAGHRAEGRRSPPAGCRDRTGGPPGAPGREPDALARQRRRAARRGARRAVPSPRLRCRDPGRRTAGAPDRRQGAGPGVGAPRTAADPIGTARACRPWRTRRASERSGERRPMAPPSEGRARCRTALGARDGVAAKNLLGAILNEGGLSREDIGRIQIRDTFSLIELPEANLERLLTKLKDTRVAGKALRLRRYRED